MTRHARAINRMLSRLGEAAGMNAAAREVLNLPSTALTPPVEGRSAHIVHQTPRELWQVWALAAGDHDSRLHLHAKLMLHPLTGSGVVYRQSFQTTSFTGYGALSEGVRIPSGTVHAIHALEPSLILAIYARNGNLPDDFPWKHVTASHPDRYFPGWPPLAYLNTLAGNEPLRA